MTNCINCGAPLHGNKCEYCGTEYGNNFDSNNHINVGINKAFGLFSCMSRIGWINRPSESTPLCHKLKENK